VNKFAGSVRLMSVTARRVHLQDPKFRILMVPTEFALLAHHETFTSAVPIPDRSKATFDRAALGGRYGFRTSKDSRDWNARIVLFKMAG